MKLNAILIISQIANTSNLKTKERNFRITITQTDIAMEIHQKNIQKLMDGRFQVTMGELSMNKNLKINLEVVIITLKSINSIRGTTMLANGMKAVKAQKIIQKMSFYHLNFTLTTKN